MRLPALPELATSRIQPAQRAGVAQAQFKVDEADNLELAAEAGKAASPESFKRFEAMVLQTFIQKMLPADGAAVYGKGMAGDMWKSMLAEKMAEVMADRGGIGIADRMLGAHYVADAKPAQEIASTLPTVPAGEKKTDSRFLVAPAVLDGMQRALSELLAVETLSSPADQVQSTTKPG